MFEVQTNQKKQTTTQQKALNLPIGYFSVYGFAGFCVRLCFKVCLFWFVFKDLVYLPQVR